MTVTGEIKILTMSGEFKYLGDVGPSGPRGETGNGIQEIVKTDTQGLIDTYTITYTNGNTVTFTITNGRNGENGTDGRDGLTTSVNGIEQEGGNVDIDLDNIPDGLIRKLITNAVNDLLNYYNKSETDILLNTKVDKQEGKSLISDTEIERLSNVHNYDDTEVKADIEALETSKANASDIPTNTSDLVNNSGFITNAVNNLINYYLKSETYTKAEVNTLIGNIVTVQIVPVDVLPQTGEANKIYLVPSSDPDTQNARDEYIWFNNEWELIGSTQIDLTGYATEVWVNSQIADFLTSQEINTLLSTKVDKEEGKRLSTNDYTTEEKNKLEGIEDNANNYVLPNDVVQDEDYVHTDNNFDNSYKEKVEENTTARHTHTNKEILDNTTANYTSEEKIKLEGLENYDDTELIQQIATKNKIFQVTEFPENPNPNDIYQYLGTDGTYIRGHFYKYIESNEAQGQITTTSTTITDLTLNIETFANKHNIEMSTYKDGEYIFQYTPDGWFNTTIWTLSDLSEWGISYTGTPNIDDTITVAYIRAKEARIVEQDIEKIFFTELPEANEDWLGKAIIVLDTNYTSRVYICEATQNGSYYWNSFTTNYNDLMDKPMEFINIQSEEEGFAISYLASGVYVVRGWIAFVGGDSPSYYENPFMVWVTYNDFYSGFQFIIIPQAFNTGIERYVFNYDEYGSLVFVSQDNFATLSDIVISTRGDTANYGISNSDRMIDGLDNINTTSYSMYVMLQDEANVYKNFLKQGDNVMKINTLSTFDCWLRLRNLYETVEYTITAEVRLVFDISDPDNAYIPISNNTIKISNVTEEYVQIPMTNNFFDSEAILDESLYLCLHIEISSNCPSRHTVYIDTSVSEPSYLSLYGNKIGANNVYDLFDGKIQSQTEINDYFEREKAGQINPNTIFGIYIYVDGENGNDTTGDGTTDNPYKTITKAVSKVPTNLSGKTAFIQITPGTYNEQVLVYGKTGGYVSLMPYTAGQITIRSFLAAGCDMVVLNNFTSTSVLVGAVRPAITHKTFKSAYFNFISSKARLYQCKVLTSTSTSYGVYATVGSQVEVDDIEFQSQNTCVLAEESNINIKNYYGGDTTANTNGFECDNGMIIRSPHSTNPFTVTTLETKTNGGQIFS